MFVRGFDWIAGEPAAPPGVDRVDASPVRSRPHFPIRRFGSQRTVIGT
jgi:hypothetical protein